MTKNNGPIIRTSGVTKTFYSGDQETGRLDVLRGISLSVRRGEIVAIVGASGAGKSTLLHIIGTLDRPTSGEVLFMERSFSREDEGITVVGEEGEECSVTIDCDSDEHR